MTPSHESSGLAWGGQTLTLDRYLADDAPNLRAWNAADEHLLKVLQDEETGHFRLPIWIFGDSFGGLTCAMALAAGPKLAVGDDGAASGVITHWSDSYLAAQAARQNLERNGLPADAIQWVGSTADPHHLRGSARTVLMQVPKSLALFEYMLEWMKPRIGTSTRFLCAGMTKHLSPHVRSILRQRVGPTDISPVYKKSVVFTASPEYLTSDEEALTPEWFTAPGSTARVFAFPGVFGGDRLDNGTRLLLSNLPKVEAGQRVVDLGCGSGVIGMTVKQREPGAEVVLVDESYLAIASARLTFHENGLRAAELWVDDGLSELEAESVDWVVSNPPFHVGHALSPEDARRHFEPVRQVLKPGGGFVLVGAHGVDYGPGLERVFGSVKRVASDRRYRIFSCTKAAAS